MIKSRVRALMYHQQVVTTKLISLGLKVGKVLIFRGTNKIESDLDTHNSINISRTLEFSPSIVDFDLESLVLAIFTVWNRFVYWRIPSFYIFILNIMRVKLIIK